MAWRGRGPAHDFGGLRAWLRRLEFFPALVPMSWTMRPYFRRGTRPEDAREGQEGLRRSFARPVKNLLDG